MTVKRRNSGFTLVELLVVIGIIALLISILLPALSKARESANTIKCSANLHSIGLGITQYVSEFKGVLPASNFYYGLQITNNGTKQAPTTPSAGYVHWSSYLYAGSKHSDPNDPVYQSTQGWEMFQCPSLDQGGLPPANTYAANRQGLGNEAGDGVIDLQAPRLAYMLNEALAPRSVFVQGFRGATRPYHFVKSARVKNSAETILATEFWGTQTTMAAASNIDGSSPVSNTRRPVSGISKELSNIPTADSPYKIAIGGVFGWATVDKLTPNPEIDLPLQGIPPNPDTTLDFVGRNHGSKKFGRVGGDNRSGWDLRKSNFLYLDGHVETKHVTETIYPKTQWGADFYSIN